MEVSARLLQVRQIGDKRRGIARLNEDFGQGHIFVVELMPPGQLHRFVLIIVIGRDDPPARIQLAPDGNRRHALRIRVLEYDRLFRKTVQVRAFHPLASISRQVIRAERIGNQQDDIQVVSLLFGRALPVRASTGGGLRSGAGSRGKAREAG